MAEWSKALDSKSSRPPKGLEGSNPSLSASLRSAKAAHPPSRPAGRYGGQAVFFSSEELLALRSFSEGGRLASHRSGGGPARLQREAEDTVSSEAHEVSEGGLLLLPPHNPLLPPHACSASARSAWCGVRSLARDALLTLHVRPQNLRNRD